MQVAIKIGAIVMALLAGFFAQDFFASHNQAVVKPSLDKYCLLSTSPCAQNNVTMSMNQDAPHPLAPITLTVNWPETHSKELILQLTGLEMEMGRPIFKLNQIRQGAFQGKIILPACTLNSMTWLGELTDGVHTVYPAIRTKQ